MGGLNRSPNGESKQGPPPHRPRLRAALRILLMLIVITLTAVGLGLGGPLAPRMAVLGGATMAAVILTATRSGWLLVV